MSFIALCAITMPATLLVGAAVAIGLHSGQHSLLNVDAHGWPEML